MNNKELTIEDVIKEITPADNNEDILKAKKMLRENPLLLEQYKLVVKQIAESFGTAEDAATKTVQEAVTKYMESIANG